MQKYCCLYTIHQVLSDSFCKITKIMQFIKCKINLPN